MDARVFRTHIQDEACKESINMAKLQNLKKWKNGEIFNARDYVYERNEIINLINEHEDRIAPIESFYFSLDADLAQNYVNKQELANQSVAGLVNFERGIQSEGVEVRTGIKTFIQSNNPDEALAEDFWIELEN